MIIEVFIKSNYGSDLRFYTHDGSADVDNIATQYATERMCILSNGNVGIGTTSVPVKVTHKKKGHP